VLAETVGSDTATLPVPYRVTDRVVETHDAVTLTLRPVGEPITQPAPGQFTMLYAPRVGEVAISVSDVSSDPTCFRQTVRDVGAVSRALHDTRPENVLGVRGPFGVGWDLGAADGKDVVVVAGGLGLAPLRPVVHTVLADRNSYGRLIVVVGARDPNEFLYRDELRRWSSDGALTLMLTVDRPVSGWSGSVGFVTESLTGLRLDPAATTAYVCGPEPMMRLSADVLIRKAVPPAAIQVSLERNMQCGIGLCGHCQLGPLLLCRDGPVVDYTTAAPLFRAKEL
jgi:NAD(P)H-flavin reductase